jgi:hypothetical protein
LKGQRFSRKKVRLSKRTSHNVLRVLLLSQRTDEKAESNNDNTMSLQTRKRKV